MIFHFKNLQYQFMINIGKKKINKQDKLNVAKEQIRYLKKNLNVTNIEDIEITVLE